MEIAINKDKIKFGRKISNNICIITTIECQKIEYKNV